MKKENNRHVSGNNNGKFGKKEARINAAAERPARSIEERMQAASAKEKAKLGI